MRLSCVVAFVTSMALSWFADAATPSPVHVWEKQEVTLTSAARPRQPVHRRHRLGRPRRPGLPQTDLRILGRRADVPRAPAGDGARHLVLDERIARRPTPGLAGKTGSFTAVAWSEAEKQANPLRRGFLRATANGHALEQADGTPFFVIGDTWYSVGTNRFRWYDDDRERPIGPDAGFKDYVRYRKAQGYNWVNVIAAFPNWMTDGKPWLLMMDDGTAVRSAWLEFGTGSAKNMDNEGGRPFLFPGKVPGYENVFPDVDRINPEYFRYLDRKIDYLNAHGFVPFIEVSRRDAGPALEEVLQVAGLVRALHPVRLVALPGEQHRPEPGAPRHHRHDGQPDEFSNAIRIVKDRSGRRRSARCSRPTPTRRRWRTGARTRG